VTELDRERTETTSRFFYGWAIVAATFVMLMTSSGLAFYALTLYLRTLTDVRGFSVSAVSGATALFFVVSGLVGLGVGHVIARHDPRPVIAGGAVLAAIALVAIGRVNSLWQVYAAYALFGAGFAGCGLVPSSTLVARWFHRRRSVALSVSSTGLSVGGILLTPAATALIDHLGFATATVWLAGGFLLGVIPITALLLRPDPSTMGLAPDDDALAVAVPGVAGAPDLPAAAPPGVRYDEAIRTVQFRIITVAWMLALLSQVGGIAHLFSLVESRVDARTAALAVSVLASCSMIGRLGGGWLLAKVPLRPACLVCFATSALGLGGLGLLNGRTAILLCAAVFGLSVGNVLLLQPVVLAEVFGVRDYARIFSTNQLVSMLGVASGPILLGLIRDASDGYRLPYLAATVVSLAASAVILLGGPLEELGILEAEGAGNRRVGDQEIADTHVAGHR
jgi:MFS family permease